jgi:hypothetical protein
MTFPRRGHDDPSLPQAPEGRLRPAAAVRADYVLIWFTPLPPDTSGTFQASVGLQISCH